ncbi:MAG: penicillin-binding protein [Flavobacteriales bacterium]|nr:penicillin-binding protein [Flavobacteriales bacterium]
MKHYLICLLFLLSSAALNAQVTGNTTYNFLRMSSSARVAALGGNQIAVRDNDPFLAVDNPSLLNEEMDNKLSMTYLDYVSDINYGFASYTKHFDSVGTFNIGVNYISYGDFTETDAAGNEIGSFTAGEYAYFIGYAYQIDSNFSVGANLKGIYSSLYDYQSFGLGADVGLTYYSRKRRLTVAMVAKNMGRQLTTYTEADLREDLPFEMQIGFTKRFKRVPLRVGVIWQHLQVWDLNYENPNEIQEGNSLLGDNSQNDNNENPFFENLKRHLIFNAEFLISENFNIRLGYNYFHRRELKIDEELGTIGLSWGLGFRVSKFHLSYARSAFHQAGATNTFSVSTRLSDFIN